MNNSDCRGSFLNCNKIKLPITPNHRLYFCIYEESPRFTCTYKIWLSQYWNWQTFILLQQTLEFFLFHVFISIIKFCLFQFWQSANFLLLIHKQPFPTAKISKTIHTISFFFLMFTIQVLSIQLLYFHDQRFCYLR